MLENVTCHIEGKLIPQFLSANAITTIGNLPMIFAGIFAIYKGGVSYHLEESPGLPNWGFLIGALGFWWFSWFDIMDG